MSLHHLVLQVRSGYEGLCIALPPKHRTAGGAADPRAADPSALAARLMSLTRAITLQRVTASPREPADRTAKPNRRGTARVATARVPAEQTP